MLHKLLKLSVPQIPHLYNGKIVVSLLKVMLMIMHHDLDKNSA